MSNIIIRNHTESSCTTVANLFIDEYMPQANGTYVKVYLLILRDLCADNTNISVSNIADRLWLTENDVLRSFKYWESMGLIGIKLDSEGHIRELTLKNPARKNTGASISLVTPDAESIQPSDRYTRTYTTSEIAGVAKNEEFSFVATIIEKYMEQPLSPSDVELIVYLFDNLKFSQELIFHLYDYCISHGKKSHTYIQKVAIDWDKHGVDTVDKAKAHTAGFEAEYMDVMRAFGISKAPAPAQKEYIDSWFMMGFDKELIKEACNRTILTINEPSFKYANGILEKWHKAGVTNSEALNSLDKEHETKASQAKKKSSKASSNSFNSYEQRPYSNDDFRALEQLLNK